VHRDLEQAHLTLALEGVPQSDLSLFSLQVVTNTLGGGMSSRLFQEVREKRGLCYSIYSFFTDSSAISSPAFICALARATSASGSVSTASLMTSTITSIISGASSGSVPV